MTNSFLYDLVSQMYIYSDEQDALRDKIFDSEAAVIRSLAEKAAASSWAAVPITF